VRADRRRMGFSLHRDNVGKVPRADASCGADPIRTTRLYGVALVLECQIPLRTWLGPGLAGWQKEDVWTIGLE
jgi:hypothetical protein